jgi:hypothetical protein
MKSDKVYPLEQALKAQTALRTLGGMEPELFPLQSFVGMVSDEIEHLRKLGYNDRQIADVIASSSGIEITADDIAENYAAPEARHGRPD